MVNVTRRVYSVGVCGELVIQSLRVTDGGVSRDVRAIRSPIVTDETSVVVACHACTCVASNKVMLDTLMHENEF